MKRRFLLIFPLVFGMAACADEGPTQPAVGMEDGRLDSRGAVRPSAEAPSPTIVDVALAVNAQTGEFSTLIAAVLRAGVAGELSARGQRTVFAPTDSAFAAIGVTPEAVADLPVATLRAILLYHVAPGRRDAASVVSSDRIRMANGGFTSIRLAGEYAYINDARIIATDVVATNGLIHVIDAVLLP
jgi:uncharacterized surface protein with fasciclin (FAS1) repeats